MDENIEKPVPPLRDSYRDALSKFDQGDLFKEWMEQSKLAMDWVEHHSEAFFYRRMIERKKKLVKSNLIKRAKNDPTEFGIFDGKSPNADIIKACYQSHPEYQAIEAELIKAEYEEMILEGAKWQIKERKDALENMVNMVLSGIFGKPKDPNIITDPKRWEPSREDQKKAIGKTKLVKRNVGDD